MDFINEIENRFPVDEWIVNDIHIWPIIRIQVATSIILKIAQGNQIPKQKQEKQSLLSKITRRTKNQVNYYKHYLRDFSNNDSIHNPVDVIFLGSQVSRVLVNGKWFDRYCDPIIDKFKNLGWKSLYMEHLYQYKTPRHNRGVFIQPYLDNLRIKLLLEPIPEIDYDQFSGFMEFAEYLKRSWGITLNDLQLSRNVNYMMLLADLFGKIIKSAKPTVGFVVCYYSIEGMAFNLACQRNNIPSIDIQHGFQGDLHRAYGQWNRVPFHGFELLPSFFWVWSEYEAKVIEMWNKTVSGVHQPFVGGNPWLDVCNENPVLFFGSKALEYINTTHQAKVKILFCLSGIIDYGVTITEWIQAVIKNSPTDWLWFVRLHPCEMSERARIRELLATCYPAKVELDIATDLPLPLLMQNVDIHITHWSATTLEAAVYGIPTIVVDQKGFDLFNEQIPDKLLNLALDSRSLHNSINTMLAKGSSESRRMRYIARLNSAVLEVRNLALNYKNYKK